MTKYFVSKLSLVACSLLAVNIALCANDAPPPPPPGAATSSSSVSSSSSSSQSSVAPIEGLPTGTTTTQQTDGSVVNTLPTVDVGDNQQVQTSIVNKTDKTAELKLDVKEEGSTLASTVVEVKEESTIAVQSDGSIKVTVGVTNPVETVLKPDTGTSEVTLTITATNEVKKVELPVGANISVESGRFEASVQVNTTSATTVSANITSDSTGLITAKVTNATTGQTQELKSYEGNTETVISFANVDFTKKLTEEQYNAIKSEFKSNRTFTLSERRTRATSIDGSMITVTPIANAIFEEYVSFDGKRYIKLTSGTANITIDGSESPMVLNQFYLIPDRYREIISSVATHPSGKLALKKGWNIVTPPTPCKVYASIFNNAASSSASGKKLVYVYSKKGSYETLGYSGAIEPGQGVYVKVDSDKEIDFSFIVPENNFNFTTLYNSYASYGGWKLLGVPVKTDVKTILNSGAQTFFSLQGNRWTSQYDSTLLDTENIFIDAGTGFWIK